jgi:hypothetical protein
VHVRCEVVQVDHAQVAAAVTVEVAVSIEERKGLFYGWRCDVTDGTRYIAVPSTCAK